MDLSGRRAVITGGAGHIGRVIADTFAGMGANLVLVDIDAEKLSEVGEGLSKKVSVEIKTVACDLEFEESRENLAATVRDAGGLIGMFAALFLAERELRAGCFDEAQRGRLIEGAPERVRERWRLQLGAALTEQGASFIDKVPFNFC